MRVVSYFRVSTAEQGRSGLGLEAQRAAVISFCSRRQCDVLGEFLEIESGKRDDRPQLAAALRRAHVTGSFLVIAKLDRLSRNIAFLTRLQESGVRFIAADMPEANELTIHIMAAVAQAERKAIAKRTQEALQAAKRRGSVLGNPNGAAALRRAGRGNTAAVKAIQAKADHNAELVISEIEELQRAGVASFAALANALNERRVQTPRGMTWHASSIRNVLKRIKFRT